MNRDWQKDMGKLQDIKAIYEAPGEIFYGEVSKDGFVSQDVVDASSDFGWLIGQVEKEKERTDKLKEALEGAQVHLSKEHYMSAETVIEEALASLYPKE